MRRSLILLSSAWIAGCAATPAPVIQPMPQPMVPDSWSTESERTDASTTTRPIDSSWWRSFNDSDLDRLVEISLGANRDLRASAARLDVALAQARIAGSELKPQAGASIDGSRRRQNFIGLPIPGAEGGVLSNTSTSVGASLNVSWEADLWGRLRAGRDAAALRAEAAAFDLADAGLSLAGQTAKAWFAVLEATNQVQLAKSTHENRGQVRDRIERRYRSGLRNALELRLAIANEANASAALAGRRRQLDLVSRQLEALTAREPAALEILDKVKSTASRLPSLPPPPALDLPVETLRRRPDLRASERRLSAAGLDVAAARRLLYPQLTLSGSTGRSSNQLEDLIDSDFSIWSLAAGLLQPLFQGDRIRSGIAAAEATQLDVLARHEGAVIRAVTDIESQLAADGFLAAQRSAVTTAAESSAGARDIAQDRYFAGLSDYLEVLAAEASATAAASQLLDIERQRLDHRVDLYLALGGGLPFAPTPPASEPAHSGDTLSALPESATPTFCN